MINKRVFNCVTIGVSAGGLKALMILFKELPVNFPVPVVVVQHEKADSDDLLAGLLNAKTELRVKTAEEKEELKGGFGYICPVNYHILIEENKTISLSVEAPVNFARPSIDVLFETAAIAYGSELIGVVLTGASSDGAKGLVQIKNYGGYTIVQDPETAYSRYMPDAAIAACGKPDKILSLEDIPARLLNLCMKGH